MPRSLSPLTPRLTTKKTWFPLRRYFAFPRDSPQTSWLPSTSGPSTLAVPSRAYKPGSPPPFLPSHTEPLIRKKEAFSPAITSPLRFAPPTSFQNAVVTCRATPQIPFRAISSLTLSIGLRRSFPSPPSTFAPLRFPVEHRRQKLSAAARARGGGLRPRGAELQSAHGQAR